MIKKIATGLFLLFLFCNTSWATIYTVTSTGDNTTAPYTAGQLRYALANAVSGDTIDFNIPLTFATTPPWGTYWSIQPSDTLPNIASGVIIDGESQTAFSGDTNPRGPEIEINGSNSSSNTFGIGSYTASGWEIRGLVVNNFSTKNTAGIGIIDASEGCKIYGCYIGTTPSGEAGAGNYIGISIKGTSKFNIVGSSESSKKNVISGNTEYGIYISDTSSNEIVGNLIGTNASGNSALPNNYGIQIEDSAFGNYIGKAINNGGNTISGNTNNGITITTSADANYVLANNIGYAPNSSDSKIANGGSGIALSQSSYNTIGDGTALGRNIIAGNTATGILAMVGCNNNNILNNYIGTDGSSTSLGNGGGGITFLEDCNNNNIGLASQGNVISGNTGAGLVISDSDNNTIFNNYIGLTVGGTSQKGNSATGIYIVGSSEGNVIGGALNSQRNVISGNQGGIVITGSNTNSNEVKGNFIGTDYTGTVLIGNGSDNGGISLSSNCKYNIIGGSNSDEGNLVSGNDVGISISNSHYNYVLGNLIGTTSLGASALGNTSTGLSISTGSQYNEIGNGASSGRNIISGNGSYGLYILGTNTNSNEVKGNFIGLNQAGTAAIANTSHGIFLNGDNSNNLIEGNTVSGNNANGILVSASNQTIQDNYIGINPSASQIFGNADSGLYLAGGNNIVSGNIISGNSIGLSFGGSRSTNNNVFANYIGTNSNNDSGLGNTSHGVVIAGGAWLNNLGNGSLSNGNIISGNSGYGILIQGSTARTNEVKANYIGYTNSGLSTLANGLAAISITNEAFGTIISSCEIFGSQNDATIILDGDKNTTFRLNTFEAEGTGFLIESQTGNLTVTQNLIHGHDRLVGIDAGSLGLGGKINGNININYNELRNFDVGIYVGIKTDSGATLDHNTLVNNGTGIATNPENNAGITINNTIIAFDPQGSSSSGIGIENVGISSEVSLKYSDIFGVAIQYVDLSPEAGVINKNAQFVDANNNDYHLSSNSPAINTGDPASALDPDGTRTDMGRYPYDFSSSVANTTLLSPNGGEILQTNSNHNITWTATNPAAPVTRIILSYSTDSGSNYIYIDQNAPNTGTYSWLVPNVLSQNCLVKVEAINPNGVANDISDGVFTITEATAPVVVIYEPTSSTTWEGGLPYNIRWDAYDNLTSQEALTISLKFSRDGGNNWTNLGAKFLNNIGQIKTEIAPYINTTEAKIRVEATDEAGNLGFDESDLFTIQTISPEVILHQPIDGAFQGGSNFLVEWTASNTFDPLSMEVQSSNNSGSNWTTVASLAGSNGFYDYNYSFPTFNTSEARIRIKATNTQGYTGYAQSNDLIIDSSAPEISLLQPLASVNLVGGQTQAITWEVHDNFSPAQDISLNLYYSLDGGATWRTIASNETPSTAIDTYAWTVPSANSTDARIIIEAFDSVGNRNELIGDAFTINASGPTVSLDNPMGGEIFAGGSSEQITWVASSSSTPIIIDLSYSLNGGATWNYIATGQNNSGNYSWSVPTGNTNEARVKLLALDNSSLTATDTSFNFVIDSTSPEVTLIQPNGGETLLGSSNYAISWEASDNLTPVAIKLEYTTNGGTSWQTITPETDNTGSYNWLVPDANTNNAQVRVRATDQAGHSAFDTSNSDFTVTTSASGPEIVIKMNNKTIYNGSYIPSQPSVNVQVTNVVSITAVAITLDGQSLSLDSVIANSNFTNLEVEHNQVSPALSAGSHIITVEASNILGTTATKTITDLKVRSGVQAGYLIFNPLRWNPATDGPGQIAFTLSEDEPVSLAIYSTSGQIVWLHNFDATAGYNVVQFDGKSKINPGSYIPNGAYIIKLISREKNKQLAKAYFIVFQ